MIMARSMTMPETKVVRVNHGKVFSDGDWFTFHCPHCKRQISQTQSSSVCEHCHKQLDWQK